MKICILSVQRVQNFGSLLQSYALKSTLETLGHSVAFLDIERNEADNLLLAGKQHDHGIREIGLLGKLKKVDRYTGNRIRNKVRNGTQLRKMDAFRQSALGIGPDAQNRQYDCCVIGSDEVFNCMTGASWGFTGQLFGDVRQADRVITYGASAGATVPEELPDEVKDRIREAFQNVSAFSVRDENTRRMVAMLTDKPVAEHFDPVLIGDFDAELKETRLPKDLPERYCVVYSYYNRIRRKEEIEALQDFCRKHRMEIVTVGAPQMWARNFAPMDPFQVLRVFENAAFAVTDTFHGTIFSARFADRFAVMTRSNNENKLTDLIDRLGIQSHRVTSFAQLDAIYEQKNNRERVREICTQEREKTLRYLRENIG